MPSILLLGDSMIDNAAYVRPGEPDVPAQIRAALPDHDVIMRAVDGQVAADVTAGLARDPLPSGAVVFMTAGGNDALMEIGALGDPAEITFAQAMERLVDLREGFRSRYAPLLDRLSEAAAVMVGTVYNPRFTGDEAPLQRASEGALSAFNDVITEEAGRRGYRVLEMRHVISSAGDYANPIEPSAAGGAKIAAAVADWAKALA
ncbi:MAG: SGNH/GDSL hydrolase family protein [Pseudomonadota bacterium]